MLTDPVCPRPGSHDQVRKLRPDANVAWLASSTLASLQGGLVLSQARRDPLALRRALDGALGLAGATAPVS